MLATTNGLRDWSAFDHTLAVAEQRGYKQRADASGNVSYRDWVTQIVTRYRTSPTILAWQLMNEAEVKASDGTCPPDGAAVLKSWAADVSGLIKSIDPNHLVSLGTLGSGQCGTSWNEYKDVHSLPAIDLCEYHDYGSPLVPMPGDPFNGLAFRLQQCNELNKPLFVGETGIIPNEVGGTLEARARAFDDKLRAQFTAGVVGELAWAWSALGSTLDNYDIGAADPTLRVFDRY